MDIRMAIGMVAAGFAAGMLGGRSLNEKARRHTDLYVTGETWREPFHGRLDELGPAYGDYGPVFVGSLSNPTSAPKWTPFPSNSLKRFRMGYGITGGEKTAEIDDELKRHFGPERSPKKAGGSILLRPGQACDVYFAPIGRATFPRFERAGNSGEYVDAWIVRPEHMMIIVTDPGKRPRTDTQPPKRFLR